jgi:hypothetical protein
VARDGLDDDVSQASILGYGRREGMFDGNGKCFVVPESFASKREVFACQLLEPSDFIFVGNLVRLRVTKEL